jgi:UDP-N-acetylmuramate dehydrogenase
MNAGAFGREIGELFCSATVYDPASREVFVLREGDLSFSYRKSSIAESGLVLLSAVLRLTPADPYAIAERMHAVSIERALRQPVGLPSAGCIFRRPETGESPGKLIREAGLAGERCGGAEISALHAGFIVNTGSATAKDVLCLAERAREAVFQKSGVRLDYEVELL